MSNNTDTGASSFSVSTPVLSLPDRLYTSSWGRDDFKVFLSFLKDFNSNTRRLANSTNDRFKVALPQEVTSQKSLQAEIEFVLSTALTLDHLYRTYDTFKSFGFQTSSSFLIDAFSLQTFAREFTHAPYLDLSVPLLQRFGAFILNATSQFLNTAVYSFPFHLSSALHASLQEQVPAPVAQRTLSAFFSSSNFRDLPHPLHPSNRQSIRAFSEVASVFVCSKVNFSTNIAQKFTFRFREELANSRMVFASFSHVSIPRRDLVKMFASHYPKSPTFRSVALLPLSSTRLFRFDPLSDVLHESMTEKNSKEFVKTFELSELDLPASTVEKFSSASNISLSSDLSLKFLNSSSTLKTASALFLRDTSGLYSDFSKALSAASNL